MSHTIFLSYPSVDQKLAELICAALEQSGTQVWMAPRNIEPGQDWGGAIIEAINQSKLMVLIFNQHADSSPQVLREVERAVAKRVRIITFRTDKVLPTSDMEYYLGATHWLNAFEPPIEPYIQKLVKTVSNAIKNPGAYAHAARKIKQNTVRRLSLTVLSSPVAKMAVTLILLLVLATGWWFIHESPRVRMIYLANDMKDNFSTSRNSLLKNNKANFGPVTQDIAKLLAIDPDNGHALYYRGAVLRLSHPELFTAEGCIKQITAASQVTIDPYENDFYRYLDNESGLPPQETGGSTDVKICYQRPHGYCPQRTAWISHLLANDLYAEAMANTDSSIKIQDLEFALKYVNEAKTLYPPAGFDQCTPTEALAGKVSNALKALRAQGISK